MSGVLCKAMALAMCTLLLACSSPPAPVEDRSARAPGGYRLSGQGLYRVQRGDTLYSIAFHYGLDWKSIAGWNGIRSPYTIYPGQELRLTAPPDRQSSAPGITTRPAPAPSATTRTADIPPASAETAPSPAAEPVPSRAEGAVKPPAGTATSAAVPSTASGAPSPPQPGPLRNPDSWLWPTEGPLISRFNAADPARKGIDIAGTEGQGVIASAAGDVVYSGNGLIGFGELIIIKHSDSMLTAYAHNRRRLVQEGERVAAGSLIAEMGRNDQEKTMLHFELRIDGKPVDPLKFLPPR